MHSRKIAPHERASGGALRQIKQSLIAAVAIIACRKPKYLAMIVRIAGPHYGAVYSVDFSKRIFGSPACIAASKNS